MKKRTIVILSVLTVILAVSAVGVIIIFSKIKKFNEYMENVRIDEIYPESIPDGTYHGFTDAGPIIVDLSVTVKSGRIKGIDLVRHVNGRGNAASEIIYDVIENQSLKIDMISGATYSSKVILDTIEQALTQLQED